MSCVSGGEADADAVADYVMDSIQKGRDVRAR
jgi:hypothetical protein